MKRNESKISCELLKKRTLTLIIDTDDVANMEAGLVVNCLKREH